MPNESHIEVRRIPGTLPETWERSAVFFANLLSLFFGNREETRLLQKHVGRIETYGGRLIPIIDLLFRNRNNLLILEREPVPELVDYFQDDLGLSVPEIRVVPHSLYTRAGSSSQPLSRKLAILVDELSRHPARWMDGFVTDEVLVSLAGLTGKKQISTFVGSRKGNDKVLLQDFLAESNLPVFESFKAFNVDDVRHCLSTLEKKGYCQAVVKAAIGASGIGMVKLRVDAPAEIPDYLFQAGPCLVQGWLDETCKGCKTLGSPSVQVFINENSLSLYDMTDQILSTDSVHEGNISPPQCIGDDQTLLRDLLDQAARAATWLHGQGYRGTASVDFLLIERQGRITAYICELNARVTGATYPSLLARHFLPGGAWQMRNVLLTPPQTAGDILALLRRESLLYLPGKTAGLFPINFNQNKTGRVEKCQLLTLAPDAAATTDLFERIKSLQAFAWDYDRD